MSLCLPYTLMSLVLDISQMVLAALKHLKIAKIIILNNVFYCNFPKKSIPGHVPALALHLDVFGAGLQPDGPGCPETPSNSQYNHTLQPLLLQLSQKINPWACPCSCPTP